MTTSALKRTPLFDAHVEAGGKLVPFAGLEMPVHYEGIRAEHLAVRTHVGVFDVSHMGEVEVEGPQARSLLQLVLSNDVAKLAIGGAQYSCLCREDAGVLDDLFAYRLGGDRFLVVADADRRLAWFAAGVRDFEVVEVRDVADRFDAGRAGAARPPPRFRSPGPRAARARMRATFWASRGGLRHGLHRRGRG